MTPKRLFLLWLVAAGCGYSALSAASDQPLRYKFSPNETNAYKITIESQSDAGLEVMEGVFTFWAAPAGGNFFTLGMRGQFHAKPVQGRPPMMFRPGIVPLFSMLNLNYGPQQVREVCLDDRGTLAKSSGDVLLPIPLGTLFTAIFPELPEDARANWESSTRVYVMDDPLLQGPAHVFSASPFGGPYMSYTPGRPAPGTLAASFKTKSALKEGSESGVAIGTTMALDTLLTTGDEPRISASAEVERVFDLSAGLLKSVSITGKCTLAAEHTTRRINLKFTAERLEGDRLQAALKPPPPPKTPEQEKISSEAAAALVEKLSSTDTGARINAANELSQKTIEKLDAASLDKLARLADAPDDYVRRAALKTLAAHARPSDLPVLFKAAMEEDSSLRQASIKAIGEMKTPKAAAALSDLLAAGTSENFSRQSEVGDALIKMGPIAETAVLPLLKEKNTRTLIDACNVLRDIGTTKSLGNLKGLVAHPSKNVSEASAAAVRAISSRASRD